MFSIFRKKSDGMVISDVATVFGQLATTEQYGKLYRALYVQKKLGNLVVKPVSDNSKSPE